VRQPHARGRKVSEEYIVPRQPAPSPRPAQLRRRGLVVVRVSIDPLRIVLELWRRSHAQLQRLSICVGMKMAVEIKRRIVRCAAGVKDGHVLSASLVADSDGSRHL
jgi:hypothetical protein